MGTVGGARRGNGVGRRRGRAGGPPRAGCAVTGLGRDRVPPRRPTARAQRRISVVGRRLHRAGVAHAAPRGTRSAAAAGGDDRRADRRSGGFASRVRLGAARVVAGQRACAAGRGSVDDVGPHGRAARRARAAAGPAAAPTDAAGLGMGSWCRHPRRRAAAGAAELRRRARGGGRGWVGDRAAPHPGRGAARRGHDRRVARPSGHRCRRSRPWRAALGNRRSQRGRDRRTRAGAGTRRVARSAGPSPRRVGAEPARAYRRERSLAARAGVPTAGRARTRAPPIGGSAHRAGRCSRGRRRRARAGGRHRATVANRRGSQRLRSGP